MLAPDHVFKAIEIAATIAFAASGFIEAARKRMDIVGIFAVAFLCAFGGGTLRDILLDRRPFFWVQHVEYVWLVLLLSLVAIPLLRLRSVRFTALAIQIADALGLGLFTVSGTGLAQAAGLPALIAVMLGVVTATFGGVLRDIVCNEIPTLFNDQRPYALCAFGGAWLYLGLPLLGVPHLVAAIAAVGGIAGLRAVALLHDWKLPPWGGRR